MFCFLSFSRIHNIEIFAPHPTFNRLHPPLHHFPHHHFCHYIHLPSHNCDKQKLDRALCGCASSCLYVITPYVAVLILYNSPYVVVRKLNKVRLSIYFQPSFLFIYLSYVSLLPLVWTHNKDNHIH